MTVACPRDTSCIFGGDRNADAGASQAASCRPARRRPALRSPDRSAIPVRTHPHGVPHEVLQDRGHSGRRHRHGGDRRRGRGARRLRQARRRLRVRGRPLRLGRRVLQEARPHDAGERPRPDPKATTPSCSARPALPTCPTTSRCGACGSPSASRSTSTPTCARPASCPASPAPLRSVNGHGARLGDRARELGGRVCRRRRPRAPGLAAGGRDRRRDVHPRRRRAHHALRLRARPLAAAQAPDRRHQVERPAPRHGDVGRDRRRGRRASSPT